MVWALLNDRKAYVQENSPTIVKIQRVGVIGPPTDSWIKPKTQSECP